MFVCLDREAEMVEVFIDDRPVAVPLGATAAVALLLANDGIARIHPVTGEVRSPHCLMGACFECLADIDGRPGTRACMRPVAAGMVIHTGIVR
ncbi:sarcosine oxidase [Acidovorax sp. SUPP2522]|uniref:2Fe-2S iron-sulfur cluster-binding protein n=1 Tax=unclassified Acidovorax TaxID=2684926 RepID=UPI00234920DC|nr:MULTISPECIES: 2Fe-2S iron-sulfur cluster-binding protein [unclassified Acidovorax]WCM96138.1 (2Fe-2S)-binding protein [Acidovorax sp. GBBC 1281]GKT19941.1 sarcosine oxidase [Acidovorax sp. SUPP2522]